MFPKKHAVRDDYESQNRHVQLPEVCVDYLSYDFDEFDLAASWQRVTKEKNDIVNGLRLENASWRTWAKQKNKLKTVSPETLNWLKDSDVTWLYGPLHRVINDEDDRYAKPKTSSTEDTLGLMTPSFTPATTSLTSSSPSLAPPPPPSSAASNASKEKSSLPSASPSPSPSLSQVEGMQEPTMPASKPLKSALKKLTMSERLKRSASELQVEHLTLAPNVSITEANKQLGAFSPAVIATHRQPKLRFNQYVEQCIALSSGDETRTSRRQLIDSSDDESSSSSASDDEDAIVMRQPRSSIKKIAPARLKSSSQSEHETDVSSLSSSSSSGPAALAEEFGRRRVSVSSWDDDTDSDAQSMHYVPVRRHPNRLPSRYQQQQEQTNQAIQWVGQSCIYDVIGPTETEDDGAYDFEDDDDWDTQEEDGEEIHPLPSTSTTKATATSTAVATTTTTTDTTPRTSRPGHQIPAKSAPVSEPSTIDASMPEVVRTSSYHKMEDIQRMDQQHRNNSNNQSSILGQIAQIASSYLWPKTTTSTTNTMATPSSSSASQ
ncbi:hypothetical protein EC973_003700 [Apophysomyces ossiformis]|uniref:Nitrogen regulatory protein areA GATA-like domain-containing protein n=1 Tax=Apophysomyces ossiformis TaxID=679940 RepID=A0A8H7BGY3_9FUNG|nr:hypothetical protein EC973_003700 [Apophysomyces ossiformis]